MVKISMRGIVRLIVSLLFIFFLINPISIYAQSQPLSKPESSNANDIVGKWKSMDFPFEKWRK